MVLGVSGDACSVVAYLLSRYLVSLLMAGITDLRFASERAIILPREAAEDEGHELMPRDGYPYCAVGCATGETLQYYQQLGVFDYGAETRHERRQGQANPHHRQKSLN